MATSVKVLSLPDVDIDDLPTVDVEVQHLPTVDVDVSSLPDLKITEVGPVGPVTLAGIPDHYTVGISQLPDVVIRIHEIPSVRAHVPANFRLGLSVLGVELAALHLCGEAQVITEPYVRNPCEKCGTSRDVPDHGDHVSAVLRLKTDG